MTYAKPNKHGVFLKPEAVRVPVPAPSEAVVLLAQQGARTWRMATRVYADRCNGQSSLPGMSDERYTSRELALHDGVNQCINWFRRLGDGTSYAESESLRQKARKAQAAAETFRARMQGPTTKATNHTKGTNMATTLKRKAAAKEPSLEKLAKQRARGHQANGNGHAAGKLNPSLVEELGKAMRTRARRLYDLAARAGLGEDDREFLYRVESGVKLDPPDVVRLQVLLERHAKLLNGEAVPGNGKANGRRVDHFDPSFQPASVTVPPGAPAEYSIVRLKLTQLERHPDNRQPTREAVAARAESMQREGQHEPIVVREITHRDGGLYQVLSGETRWLAAEKLKWKEINARIVECDDARALTILAEANGQRADLTPIDKAKLIERLCATPIEGGAGLTRDQAARRVGLNDGASASNLVRLLKLPKQWQDRVASGELNQSWARELCRLADAPKLLDEAERRWQQAHRKGAQHHDRRDWESRVAVEELVDRIVHKFTRPIERGAKFWYDSTHFSGPDRWQYSDDYERLFDLTPEVEKYLEIREFQDGKKTVRLATNAAAYDKLQVPLIKAKVDAKRKKGAEKAGRDNPAKKEMTAAERKALDAKQAKQLKERIDAWRHKLLRLACIAKIDDDQDNGLRLVLAYAASPAYREPSFAQVLCQATGAKLQYGGYATRANYWSAVAAMKHMSMYDEHRVLGGIAKVILAHEAADWRSPTLPLALVERYAEDLHVDVQQAWLDLQVGPANGKLAGEDLLEEFFLLHQTAELADLGKELGVHLEGKTRAAMVKFLLSVPRGTTRRLPLPKCIAPVAGKQGTAKATKHTKKAKG